jgi:hypothetical protein
LRETEVGERERSEDGDGGDAKSQVNAVCSKSALHLIATGKRTSQEVRNVPIGDIGCRRIHRSRRVTFELLTGCSVQTRSCYAASACTETIRLRPWSFA